MHFDIQQNDMSTAVALNRKPSCRTRRKGHGFRLARLDNGLNVITMQMKNGAAIGRPIDFNRIIALNADGFEIAGKPAVFDAQLETL
jgi:hypothetical protein